MSRPLVLVTRPQPQAVKLAVILEQDGAEVLIDPLLQIVPVPNPPLDLQGVQALLLTSPNGVEALAAATTIRNIPVFAVGDATATAAQAVGFAEVTAAEGDAVSLVALVRERLSPADGALWHGRGAVIAHDLAADLQTSGFVVRSTVLYAAEAAMALSPQTAHHLRVGDVQSALFFSPRTALTFCTLAQDAQVVDGTRHCVAYALSAKVADALAELPWGAVRVATEPSQAALLSVWRDRLASLNSGAETLREG